MAIFTSTNAPLEAIAPQALAEAPTAILAALITVVQHTLRVAAQLVRHVERVTTKSASGFGENAHPTTRRTKKSIR